MTKGMLAGSEGPVVQLRIDGDACSLADTPHSGTRQVAYQTTEKHHFKRETESHCSTTDSTQIENVYEGWGKGSHQIPVTRSTETCTGGGVVEGDEDVAVTKYRDVPYSFTTSVGTWTGTATVTWEGGARVIPFTLSADAGESALDAAARHEAITRDLAHQLSAALEPIRSELRKARGAREYARYKTAAEPRARVDALFGALAWDGAYRTELEGWLHATYGVGFGPEPGRSVAPDVVALSLPDFNESLPTPCKECIGRAWYKAPPKEDLSYRWIPSRILTYARLDTGSAAMREFGTNVNFGIDLRPDKVPGEMRVGSYLAEIGLTSSGGLGLAMRIEPLGLAYVGARVMLSLTGGVGFSGYITTKDIEPLPFTWELPVEARLSFIASRNKFLILQGRASWVTGDSRAKGALDATFTDELEAGLGIDWISDDTVRHLGVSVEEQLGVRRIGLIYGHVIDLD